MEYMLGIYEKALPQSLDWPRRLCEAKKAGFDALEMSIDESPERRARLHWSKSERTAIHDAMRRSGMPIRSMCLSAHRKFPIGSADPEIRARGMEIMEMAMQLADDLGMRIIQLAGYDAFYEPSTPETQSLFLENLYRCAQIAAKYGVPLGFETMDTEFMNTTEKAMGFVRLVGSPYLGLYPDIGNMTNAAKLYGTSEVEDLHKGAGHIFALHLKETVPGKDRGIPFGTGHVDFNAAAETAWSLGVRRFLAECWDDGSPAWQKNLAQVNRFLRDALDSACISSTIASSHPAKGDAWLPSDL